MSAKQTVVVTKTRSRTRNNGSKTVQTGNKNNNGGKKRCPSCGRYL